MTLVSAAPHTKHLCWHSYMYALGLHLLCTADQTMAAVPPPWSTSTQNHTLEHTKGKVWLYIPGYIYLTKLKLHAQGRLIQHLGPPPQSPPPQKNTSSPSAPASLPPNAPPDFFTTAVHARFQYIVLTMIGVFISSFLSWAVIYYAIWRWEPKCFLGFHSFLSAFLFSIETQNTIGTTQQQTLGAGVGWGGGVNLWLMGSYGCDDLLCQSPRTTTAFYSIETLSPSTHTTERSMPFPSPPHPPLQAMAPMPLVTAGFLPGWLASSASLLCC